ncbi:MULTISPECIES: hypothetical protein [unclassified Paenibacillus]|uniref:hypothetical protein n=1 Tax=unclassified Paenibacillus TaxID=185978 RepID=UPI001C125C52|nr:MULTISPECIES: hypothetical protein [unclassified Paenibacillus]MBU5440573.1 hypothetical protein [Paenibacillus sp. MSJ-34]CAH0120039.1 hypothetical protein PAE9249_02552 [Paenibacillus sp. CECT 9249]
MAKTLKKKKLTSSDRNVYTMKIVTSETCHVCKQQCARGLRYLERMSQPGAVGNGVPCILTRVKVSK